MTAETPLWQILVVEPWCETCEGTEIVHDGPVPSWMEGCTEACEVWPECRACGKDKAPVGRSLALEMVSGYCDFECDGYHLDPKPGHLFPGELERERERRCPDCAPSPVRVVHRDGCIGEVE